MRIASLLLALLGTTAAFSAESLGESALRWKLDIARDGVKVNNAGRIEVRPPRGDTQVYYYVVYTITNHHDEAVPLHLNVIAETDVGDGEVNEGFYPRAMVHLRKKFNDTEGDEADDILDSVQLAMHELPPGETVRAAAVFQFFKPGTRDYDDRADSFVFRFQGYADPVKRDGLNSMKETLELRMYYQRKGDEFDAHREPITFMKREEKVM